MKPTIINQFKLQWHVLRNMFNLKKSCREERHYTAKSWPFADEIWCTCGYGRS